MIDVELTEEMMRGIYEFKEKFVFNLSKLSEICEDGKGAMPLVLTAIISTVSSGLIALEDKRISDHVLLQIKFCNFLYQGLHNDVPHQI